MTLDDRLAALAARDHSAQPPSTDVAGAVLATIRARRRTRTRVLGWFALATSAAAAALLALALWLPEADIAPLVPPEAYVLAQLEVDPS